MKMLVLKVVVISAKFIIVNTVNFLEWLYWGGEAMFKLDLIILDYIFPWSNYAFYGFGIYAKFIITLLFGQQVFNIVYDSKKKRSEGKKW